MNKPVVFVTISVFILVMGTGIVAPLIAPYANHLGASGLWVGILYSGFYLVRLVFGTPIGRLADRKGPKAMLTYSLALYPFIAIGYFLASSVTGLFGARLLHGVASAMMLPMAMAYMGEICPRGQEGRYMGIVNMVIFVANGVGPLVGGYLVEMYGTQIGFLSLLGLSVVALFVIIAVPNVKSKRKAMDEESSARNTFEMNKFELQNHPGLLALASLNIVMAVLSIFMVSFFTLYAQNRGLGVFAIGFLIALNNVVVGATQIPFGRLVDRLNRFTLVLVSGSATAALLIAFPLVHRFWMIALLLVALGLTSAVTLAASSALSAILGRSSGMGRSMGFLGSASSLGMVIGPISSGFLLDHFNIDVTFFFSSALWLLGTLVFGTLWSVWKRRESAQTLVGEME